MNMETQIICPEEQKFASWFRWLTYISMAVAAFLILFGLKKELAEQSATRIHKIILAVALGIAVPMGIAYNVRGNKGVQLEFNDGKKVLIGSQRAKELEKAIRSITS